MNLELSDQEVESLRQILDRAWWDADRLRLTSTPGTNNERDVLQLQQTIENLQGRLRKNVPSSR